MKVFGYRATKCGTQGVDGVYRGRNRPCADEQATGREGKRKEAKEKMLTPSVVSARSRIESPVVSVRSLVGLGGLSFAFFFGSNAAAVDGCCGFAPNGATGASPQDRMQDSIVEVRFWSLWETSDPSSQGLSRCRGDIVSTERMSSPPSRGSLGPLRLRLRLHLLLNPVQPG
ncbi:hypothetical protein LCI18_005411 [Fusarium solani-melongenae]|uniref:Uncharacterized protein n=1 Tax=Fusarium solani subsp. cucurbitae TaxID=2747967 RepID=A0ACD3Z0R8_FUSSC|nr:hypothetical protein LCI18_005411 [Fusarium solani-melongenae]